jgi:hypothetical protein
MKVFYFRYVVIGSGEVRTARIVAKTRNAAVIGIQSRFLSERLSNFVEIDRVDYENS